MSAALNNQKGIVQVFLLILFLVGLGLGVYLIGRQTQLKSHASIGTPEDSISMVPYYGDESQAYLLPVANPEVEDTAGTSFGVDILVKTTTEPINLVSTKIKYDPGTFSVNVLRDSTQRPTFIKNWIEEENDETTGTITLSGGVPNPGFQSSASEAGLFARIIFKSREGTTGRTSNIEFLEDGTALYKNSDAQPITTFIKRSIAVKIGNFYGPRPSVTVSGPISTSIPEPILPGVGLVCGALGDVDGDGKITESDGELVLKFVAALVSPTPAQKINADADKNGNITSGDSLLIKRVAAGLDKNFASCQVIQPSPVPSPSSAVCAQVITPAVMPSTGQCQEFSTSCITSGWTALKGTVSCSKAGDLVGDAKFKVAPNFSVLMSKFNNANGSQPSNWQVADINGDGAINIYDISIIRSIYIGKGLIKASLAPIPVTISPTPSPVVGGPIKKAFITSTSYNGNLGGLAGADQKCQTQANLVGLSGTWKAWLSDSNVSAGSRLTHNTGQYRSVNGSLIANNWNDLTDGSLASAINSNESGNVRNAGWVWTHTLKDGSIDMNDNNNNPCGNWSTTNGGGSTGDSSRSDSGWTTFGGTSCTSNTPLYCIEQ